MCSVQVCRPGAGLAVAVLDLCGQMWFTLEEKARVVGDSRHIQLLLQNSTCVIIFEYLSFYVAWYGDTSDLNFS